jgi:hypothetical protein
MTINLADNSPRISYTVAEGVTQTSFAVPFEFFDNGDLNVYIDGTLKTLTTDYTVTGGDGSTGTVSMSVTGGTGGSTVVITRDIALERTTDFPVSGAFNIVALNTELDRLVAVAADLDDRASRALQLTDFDAAVSLVLPEVDTRKGKTLAFNASTGAVEAGPSISDTQTVSAASADIALLADIQDGTTATNAITTVASNNSNVTTVAGISANVTTVAGISSDVTAVAADATDIGTVATNIASVNTVATNITDVVAVANDLNEAVSEVETVANDLNEAVSEIDTVATNITNVNTVGTGIANVNTVASGISNINTVAGIDANVTTVAGISSDVTTVAGISSNVTAVAGDATDIGTVATNISNVNTVAGNNTNITTVAGISSNVTTVAGISANVTTVAGDTTNIGTIATNLGGTDTIGTVAGSISNVNTVGGAIANVNTVATNISGVNSFAERYRVGSADPTTSLDEGDLFFNTTSNAYKFYDGSSWQTVNVSGIGSVADDTTPQLGGNLDVNGNEITSASSGNVVLNPNGSGQIQLNSTVVVEDGTHDFDIASHDGTNGLKLGGVLVTSTAAEINKLDGFTGVAADLEFAKDLRATGVTTSEFDKLDGLTATTTELNYLDITTLGLSEASKVLTADANGVVSFDNGTIEEVTSITSSSNAATINLRDGNLFEHDLTENVTYTFSNPAASGRASCFILKVIQDASARTITWPTSVDWAAATAPTLTTTNNGVDVFGFVTIDGGTTYYGFTLGQAMG